jgi:predicted DNA-binding transcriptional regulator AlpA
LLFPDDLPHSEASVRNGILAMNNGQQQSFERLLNDHEVAARIGVSVATVRRWRLLGTGPQYLKIGALVRYRPQAIVAWLDNRPVGGDPSDLMEAGLRG